MGKGKRYLVTVSFYMHCKDDESVIKKARKFVEKRKKKFDDNCAAQEIEQINFGDMAGRQVRL